MKNFLQLFVFLTLASGLLGCSERPLSASDLAERNVCRAVQVLSTNVSVRTIRASCSVSTNVTSVQGGKKQMSLIGDWERALMGINVSGLAPASRYAAIREASDILNSRVSSTMRDVGCDYAEVWALHFRALAWLDKQVSAMKPGIVTITDKNLRELQMKWTYYQALAEWRETIVENHERFDFDERLQEPGMEQMDVIRARFEKMIGRPVRPASEIKLLGQFHKMVRERITKEREAALSSNGQRIEG